MDFALTFRATTGVTLGGGAFELTNQDGVLFAFDVTTTLVDGKTAAILSFSGFGIIGDSLPDGIYTLMIHSNRIFDRYGKTLDGGGDGINGGDNLSPPLRRQRWSRRCGCESDQALFKNAFNSELGTEDYLRIFDFDGDIDRLDRGEFNQRYSTYAGATQMAMDAAISESKAR